MAEPKEHVVGTMDIQEQQKTFALFWTLTKWSLILIVLLLIGLAYFFT